MVISELMDMLDDFMDEHGDLEVAIELSSTPPEPIYITADDVSLEEIETTFTKKIKKICVIS